MNLLKVLRCWLLDLDLTMWSVRKEPMNLGLSDSIEITVRFTNYYLPMSFTLSLRRTRETGYYAFVY